MAFAGRRLFWALRAGDFVQLTSRTMTAREVECHLVTGEAGPNRTAQQEKPVASSYRTHRCAVVFLETRSHLSVSRGSVAETNPGPGTRRDRRLLAGQAVETVGETQSRELTSGAFFPSPLQYSVSHDPDEAIGPVAGAEKVEPIFAWRVEVAILLPGRVRSCAPGCVRKR